MMIFDVRTNPKNQSGFAKSSGSKSACEDYAKQQCESAQHDVETLRKALEEATKRLEKWGGPVDDFYIRDFRQILAKTERAKTA